MITHNARLPLFEDYAVPWNLFSGKKELLLSGRQEGQQIRAEIGNGTSDQIIFHQGYFLQGGNWSPFSLSGAPSERPEWLRGRGTGVFDLKPGQSQAYFLGLICQEAGGMYKCGCREAICLDEPRWQIQELVKTRAPQPAADHWVMGYYPGYEEALLPPEDIDFRTLTHIAFAFLQINADGSLNTDFMRKNGEGQELARTVAIRAHAAGKKALLSVGGVHSGPSFAGALAPDRREFFIDNLLKVTRELGYDGIDLDAEPMIDVQQMADLARDLRLKQPDIILTVPVSYVQNEGRQNLKGYADLARRVDRINIMSYDMSGIWPGWYSWHHAALDGATRFTPTSLRSSVEAYLNAGVPRQKLGAGLPSYGYCWQGVTGPRQMLGADARRNEQHLTYARIISEFVSPISERWDVMAKAPYLTFPGSENADGCGFVTYDSPLSAFNKGRFIRDEGLGGVIIWTLGQGFVPGEGSPLVEAVTDGML